MPTPMTIGALNPPSLDAHESRIFITLTPVPPTPNRHLFGRRNHQLASFVASLPANL
ncbi:hypothetical protein SV7mr_39710 [Stieleria bergensis]|uniref:Uncharacterized protein n=1 Tax=Stieleria bergensis TaxID=2528025 RepID=A0A517SZ75_9BACT|nr:hypothetical protein SV7mr_39710 [Planctomycetes bacterium SV_7m_r]